MDNGERNNNMSDQNFSSNASSELNVNKLIESIRDKIQQTLEQKAEKNGRLKNS